MTIGMVKFSAEVAKGISVGTKDVTIKLLIPLAAVESRLSALAKMQEKEVMVYLGDPQGAFDFDDEDRDPMYDTWNSGRRVTTDASGVVTKIEGQGEEKDENQAELFGSEGSSPAQQEVDRDGAEQDGNASQVPPEGEGEHISEEGAGEPPTDDLPEWMRDEGTGDSEPKEMDFNSDDSEGDQQPPTDENPPAGDAEGSSGDIDPDELERYILENRPIIPDITVDVPAAIERKRGNDVTWREIAADLGMSQGKLSGMLSRYKKAVKEQMVGSGVA
nr:hypothetical protein [Paenibacillus xylanexedens]